MEMNAPTKSAKVGDTLGYDPVESHRKLENLVVRKKIGGDARKYYRFRHDRSYGGIITADCAGCGLTCKFCWARSEAVLEGRAEGEFFTPDQVVGKILDLVRENKIRQVRISGGEPTIGREHLLRLLHALKNKRIQFILETNGILIGADETYAQDLALFPFLHARVSLKGCDEEEFARLTGADPKGFQLQLAALVNLLKAGVSAHPAVMLSFSGRAAMDRLYHTIWKIDPRMHSEVEREDVILYAHVLEKLRRAKLQHHSGHFPDQKGKD
jgi:uncharacterized Fe-S cluster-containing radical SAM superfamily protein